jgi:NAD(P)-dependent dehydrogenase (short-subunit alcohol dehydrogenase family)
MRVFVTGSADGLGRATAQTLLDSGHDVIVHARNTARLSAVNDLAERGAAAVVGDLSDLEQARDVAEKVNAIGPVDAVIHNAGVLHSPDVFQVNVVAPISSLRSLTARSGWSTSAAACTAAATPIPAGSKGTRGR